MTSSNRLWTPLEHALHKRLKSEEIPLGECRCLLAVSGGLDSMVMLALMTRLQSALKIKELAIMHIHHGPSAAMDQQSFRDKARAQVKALAQAQNRRFFSAESAQILRSEDDQRRFRKEQIAQIQSSEGFDFVLWGHHQQDFVETQFLRLIRGAGPKALMPMSLLRGSALRPLLDFSKSQLEEYAKSQKLEWLEDPSNQDVGYLRNWLRQQWLPQLEAKCPGALNSISRSLGLLQETHGNEAEQSLLQQVWVKNGPESASENNGLPVISRPHFLGLSQIQKKQVLALYLKSLGTLDFTQNHLKEILKHLDIVQNEHTFESAHMKWILTRDRIVAKNVAKASQPRPS